MNDNNERGTGTHSRLRTFASILGITAACYLFVRSADNPYGPHDNTVHTSLDLIAADERLLSPIVDTRLVSRDADIVVQLTNCSEEISNTTAYGRSITEIARTALAARSSNLEQISLTDEDNEQHIVRCRKATVEFPEILQVEVELPVIFKVHAFLSNVDMMQTHPFDNASLNLHFLKDKGTLNHYDMDAQHLKTIWTRNDVDFVAH